MFKKALSLVVSLMLMVTSLSFAAISVSAADTTYVVSVRVCAEYFWTDQFAGNMFIRLKENEQDEFLSDWCIYCAPGFYADPAVDGTRQHNFSIIDFKSKRILIGGSAYTVEIKKSKFTILTFILPYQQEILSMN